MIRIICMDIINGIVLTMRKLIKDEVEFKLEVLPEETEVRGNYICSGDDEQDKLDEDEIIERLNNNDVTAWCLLKVTATWNDIEAFDYMGGCSFSTGLMGSEIEKEAESMAEDHGMYDSALDNLNAEISSRVGKVKSIIEQLT